MSMFAVSPRDIGHETHLDVVGASVASGTSMTRVMVVLIISETAGYSGTCTQRVQLV